MAVETMTVAKRRWLHFISSISSPKCIARAIRGMKRGHRRVVRQQARLLLRSQAEHDS